MENEKKAQNEIQRSRARGYVIREIGNSSSEIRYVESPGVPIYKPSLASPENIVRDDWEETSRVQVITKKREEESPISGFDEARDELFKAKDKLVKISFDEFELIKEYRESLNKINADTRAGYKQEEEASPLGDKMKKCFARVSNYIERGLAHTVYLYIWERARLKKMLEEFPNTNTDPDYKLLSERLTKADVILDDILNQVEYIGTVMFKIGGRAFYIATYQSDYEHEGNGYLYTKIRDMRDRERKFEFFKSVGLDDGNIID